jgi:hypothetical protein
MNENNPTGLAADFIKKQIKHNTELENKILELENEISLLKSEHDNDYALYRSILDLIIPNLKFEYSEEGYLIKIDPPITMPLDYINELTKEVQKYKDKIK